MGKSKIEWTEYTWNPIVGCTPVSEGCRHCYARALHDKRFKAFTNGKKVPDQYSEPFSSIQILHDRFEEPLHWVKPRRVFVCSMGDLFHEAIPFEEIRKIYDVMRKAKGHTFMVLTKRPENMLKFYGSYISKSDVDGIPEVWPLPNVWVGVSIENQEAANTRIKPLSCIPAPVRFVSCEPMIGRIDLARIEGEEKINEIGLKYRETINAFDAGINWVICGGETGPEARPLYPAWVVYLRDQCVDNNVPFFFKKWGKSRTRTINGKMWEQYPK